MLMLILQDLNPIETGSFIGTKQNLNFTMELHAKKTIEFTFLVLYMFLIFFPL